jgi:hypothetical protein
MKLSVLILAGCAVLAAGAAVAIAQSGPSPASRITSMLAWSRPSMDVPHGIQMRERIDPATLANPMGPSLVARFEPIPAQTIQALQQWAASEQRVLAWRQHKITGAVVSIDVLGDSAPPRHYKAKPVAGDPLVYEVALPCPSGGWYNQPLRIQAHVYSGGEEIFSSDSTVTLAP